MARLDTSDTIAAISSPPGPAARGLVRLSGPQAWEIARQSFTGEGANRPRSPTFHVGRFAIAGLRSPVACRLALWPHPATYTGQDLAEIHVIGCEPILNLLLTHLLKHGARLAEPGEFTLRAFLNGKMDLTRAEAVLGVIDARSEAQAVAALTQLAGGIASPIQALRDRLLDILAHLEAGLDFVEEPDVDPLGRAALAGELSDAADELHRLAGQIEGRDRPESRPRVVLVGKPNAGKSRLFNALGAENQSLVSPIAGTTRDYLSAVVECDGIAVELIDTAGQESARTPIESDAQTLRDLQAASADLLLDCVSTEESGGFEGVLGPDASRIRVATKADLGNHDEAGAIATSAATGAGLDTLRRAIATALRAAQGSKSEVATSARCRDALEEAGRSLATAASTVALGGGDELVAIDLRQALDGFGLVTGEVVTDDILDRIFRRFCIGK